MSARTRPARVAFVGAGPGDLGLLTLRAVDLLGAADAVVLDKIARESTVERFCPAGVSVVDAGHGDHGENLTHACRAKLVVDAAHAHPGGLVVRLMDGDPAVFNGLAEEMAACSRAGVPVEVVPGVSSVTAVPSYAGIPLSAATTSGIHVIVSGDESQELAPPTDAAATVVALGAPTAVARSLAHLLRAGRDASTPLALTSEGTTVRQSTVMTTLGGAAKALAKVEHPVLAVAGPTVVLRESLSWFETRPLYGWNVLVPRTKAQSASMVARLAAYGAEANVVPTISVEPPRTPQQLEKALHGLVTGRYEWVGFTSVNAVKAVRERLDAYGVDVRALAGVRVAAVGGVTAAALQEWGIRADLVPSGEQSALGLLEDWPEYDPDLDPIDRVFLPRADIATDTLVAGLKEMGWEVDDVTAYRTVRASPPPAPVREAIKVGAFDAVVFTSSSTVRNLIGIAGKPHAQTIVACIGPATAKTAQEHGLRVDVLAPEASADSLVDALADHGRSLALAAAEAGQVWRRPSQRRAASRRRAR